MKFLVAGCGSIGQRHIKNLLFLGAGQILAVDPDEKKRQAVASDSVVKVFDNMEAALEKKPEAALICTPNSMHLDQAFKAVRAGCHIFVEKPLSHNFDNIDNLARQVQAKNLVTMVGSNFKFHPCFIKIKKILDSRILGKVISARCQFGQYLPDWHPYEDFRKGYSAKKNFGGGILLDSHELDYMTWFLGDVEQVFCFSGKFSSLEIQTEDVAEVLLMFKQKTLAEVHLDYTQRVYQRNYEFFGELGTLKWDFADHKVRLYLSQTKKWEEFDEPANYDINQMYIEEMRHFISCVKSGKKTITDFDAGRKVLSLIMAAKESAKDGAAKKFKQGLFS